MAKIREQFNRTGDHEESIAIGLQRTAKIITSAAMLLIVVVIGFATQVTLMKMIGVGLLLAVVVDAVIVRGLLVPATLRLLGRATWWAPAPLSRWWTRNHMVEHDDQDNDGTSRQGPVRSPDAEALHA